VKRRCESEAHSEYENEEGFKDNSIALIKYSTHVSSSIVPNTHPNSNEKKI
jgi:hypothetical protein